MRVVTGVASLVVTGFVLLGICTAFYEGQARAVPCSLTGKDCTQRRDCVLSCKQCKDTDLCCCRHVDRCKCVDPTTGKECCE